MTKMLPGFDPPEVVDIPLPVAFERRFLVNSLVVTHRRLLLRSPMAGVHDEKIDILFKAVNALRLEFDLPAVEIRWPTELELAGIADDCGERVLARAGNQAYIISGGHSRGYVVASSALLTRDADPAANISRLLYGTYSVPAPEGSSA